MNKNRGNKVFKLNPELDKAYRKLWSIEPAGCSICGNDAIDDLGIYPSDDGNHAWQISCRVCHVSAKDTITLKGAMS